MEFRYPKDTPPCLFWQSTTFDYNSGTYDIYAKGQAHLPRAKCAASVSPEVNEIDFSDGGTVYLLGGDFDGSGKVNALDFSYLIAHYGTDDPLADLDGSGKVNALDLSMLFANFGKWGDVCGIGAPEPGEDSGSLTTPGARVLLSPVKSSGATGTTKSSATSPSSAWLSLSPSSGNYNVGAVFDVAMLLDTVDSAVDAIDVILYYDPTVLEAVEVREGSIPELLHFGQKVDASRGTISLSAWIEAGGPPVQGSDLVLATVTFKAIGSSLSSTLDFIGIKVTGSFTYQIWGILS